MSGFSDIGERLADRQRQGLYRRLRLVASPQGRELLVDGRKLLNFCSNDYLGLASDERVIQALSTAAARWGAGSGASHLVCGHTTAHAQLEEALAEFTGRPRVLLFASGYAANLGTIDALLGTGDHVLEDRLNHASLLDGGRSCGARFKRYAHRNPDDLDGQLRKLPTTASRKLVVSDGTFSMDGTTCDVAATAKVAAEHDAWLMLDEAHSFGVLGREGRGLAPGDKFDCEQVQIVVGTLGKAFGTQGGFVAGSADLIETLIQQARTYIYSTAIPAAVAEATLASLAIARAEEWRRERLQVLVQSFRNGARELGLDLVDSLTPIQPVLLGDPAKAVAISRSLEDLGFLVTPIRPPTVPPGTSRLRITLTAQHTDDDVERLLTALAQATGEAAE